MDKLFNFAIVGVAGYIATRHLEAITSLKHRIIAGVDTHDSAGQLDRFGTDIKFYQTMSPLADLSLDYISVCSPNYLHCDHIATALKWGQNVITEKPTVIEMGQLWRLQELEQQYGVTVSTISQLRLHQTVSSLKSCLDPQHRYTVQADYCAPRGRWYRYSWQSNPKLSGGLPMSIGFHLFDLLLYLFGPSHKAEATRPDNYHCFGTLTLERADVEWKLTTLPEENNGRTLIIDGQPYDLSSGFTALHTEAYRQILDGNGIGIADIQNTIELCYQLSNF